MGTATITIDAEKILPKLREICPFELKGDRWVSEGGNALLEQGDKSLSLAVTIPHGNLPQVQIGSALLIQFGQCCVPGWDAATWLKATTARGNGTEQIMVQGAQVKLVKTAVGVLFIIKQAKGFG
ncbi:MAG: hypothetical protein HC812_19130 [Leptolyngbya sp. RL_3_1]|nr:hypothetical protein [Leptolyngbya sp. RL_3_1]